MKWYQERIGRFENLSDLICSFFKEFYLVIILLIALLFCMSGNAEAFTFTCSNKTSWESKADTIHDFYNTPIRPDGSPNHTLDFSEQLDTFYSKDYNLVTYGSEKCYAAISCSDESGYNFSKGFPLGHPAWTNHSQCSCAKRPQAGCNSVKWYRKGYPTYVSGVVGTKFPAYPTPTYPTSWKKRAVYKHGFAFGTSSSNISLNILSNIDKKYLPTGTKASLESCGEGSTTIDGKEVVLKYFMVKGLKTFDQTFNATQPYQEWKQDWGMCGKVNQYWNQSNVTYVSRPAEILDIPVMVFITKEGYDYDERDKACPSGTTKSGGVCIQKRPVSNGICKAGETRNPPLSYVYRSRGSKTVCPSSRFTNVNGRCLYKVTVPRTTGSCRYGRLVHGSATSYCFEFVSASYPSCPSGWSITPGIRSQCRKVKSGPVTCDSNINEKFVSCPSGSEVNPFNSSQCRKRKDTKKPIVSVDVPPDKDKIPPWCTAKGDSWNGKTQVCTKGNKSKDKTKPDKKTGVGKGTDASKDKDEKTDGNGKDGDGKGGNGKDGDGKDGDGKDGDGKDGDGKDGDGKDGDGKDGDGTGDKDNSNSDLTADSFFKDAPVAGSSDIGSRTLGKDGFYKPTYGKNESFVTLLDAVWKKSDVKGMTKVLDGLAPPVFKAGGLPVICLPLSFLPKGETLCIKFSDYSFVFDVIKMFFYFVAVMTSWRIIVGAK